MRFLNYVLSVMVLMLLAILYGHGQEGLRLKVVMKPLPLQDAGAGVVERKMYVVNEMVDGTDDPNFMPIECRADAARSGYSCYPVAVSSAAFMLVDHFVHDEEDMTWYLQRYHANGTIDPSFHLFGLTVADDEYYKYAYASSRFNYIEKVTILDSGNLQIYGELTSPRIGWTNADARDALRRSNTPGIPHGKEGIVTLSADGAFISFIPATLGKNIRRD